MVENNTKISIGAGLFLFLMISAFLIVPYAFPADTIILTNPQGGTPVSCLPSGGLVLAQNLTDLCDVTIINPLTTQLIEYNGTQWVNVNVSQVFNDTTTCSNIGTGTAYLCVEGTNIDLRSLLAGTGISVSNNTNTITITNTVPDNTVCANVGTVGEGVYVSGECNFKKLLAGSGISLSANGTRITFTNTLPESTACNNVGTGNQLCSGGNVNLDTLIAGTGITITDTTDDWTFASQCANTGTGEAVCESSNNINSLISADTSTLTITDTTGDLTFTPFYIKLCSATATSGDTTLTCTLSSAKKHLVININYEIQTNTATYRLQFNADTGNNYEYRTATNGGADATAGNQASIAGLQINTNTGRPHYITLDCINLAATEKSCIGDSAEETPGAGNASGRIEISAKWADTTNQITSVRITQTAGTGTLTGVSNITVWGYD